MLRRAKMRTALTAAAVVVVVALAACSGGDDDGTDVAFLASVNAVCADYRPKLELIPAPTGNIDEWAATGADLADLLEASVGELRALEPPSDLAEDYEDWLGLRSEMVSDMRDAQTAGGLLDQAALDDALARVRDAMEAADPLAVQLGFEDCSPTGVDTGEDVGGGR
jgi:hypothetical protein